MSRGEKAGKAVDWRQISAFRLSRHHLTGRSSTDLLSVCRNVCGVQAQFMPPAEMALWARIRNLSRSAISSALWQERTLRSGRLLLEMRSFEKVSKVLDALIETEATSLSAFLEMPFELKY